MNKKIYSLAMGAMALSFMASCSNDVNNDGPKDPQAEGLPEVVLPKNPDLVISSNGVALAGTRALEGATRSTVKYENDEVEINLAIQDVHYLPNGVQKYDFEDLVSHLTMHVRSNTDVEVFIPVPAKFYCDQDDLYIYAERNKEAKYDGYYQKATLKLFGDYKKLVQKVGEADTYVEGTLGETLVSLNIQFLPSGENQQEGIKVWTEGINETVIDYCRWNYGDGLTFDAYNYYNRPNQYTEVANIYKLISIPKLKKELDKSTVTFGTGTYNANNVYGSLVPATTNDGTPEYYINAFTGQYVKGYAPVEEDDDATVEPQEPGSVDLENESEVEDETTETTPVTVLRDCKVKPAQEWFNKAVIGSNGYNKVYLNVKNKAGYTAPAAPED